MRRSLLTVFVALLAGALGAGVAVAATGGGRSPDPVAEDAEGVQPVEVVAQAPNARLVAHINGNDHGSGFQIRRAKGVALVTNPADGIYCIRPTDPRMVLGRIVPSVSVDWSESPVNAVMAQWSSTRRGCPRRTISIITIVGQDGTWDETNNVGFTVVVP
jgi:hypothetical protein